MATEIEYQGLYFNTETDPKVMQIIAENIGTENRLRFFLGMDKNIGSKNMTLLVHWQKYRCHTDSIIDPNITFPWRNRNLNTLCPNDYD